GARARGQGPLLRGAAGAVLTRPSAFGPITRSPYDRASPTSRRCRARPSGPISANPLDTTTSPRAPLAGQASTTSSTPSACTATTARSTVPGTSRTVGYAGTPSISPVPGLGSTPTPVLTSVLTSVLTAYSVPVKPDSIRCRNSACPIVPSRRLAPITATLDGVSSRSIEVASERCSRA